MALSARNRIYLVLFVLFAAVCVSQAAPSPAVSAGTENDLLNRSLLKDAGLAFQSEKAKPAAGPRRPTGPRTPGGGPPAYATGSGRVLPHRGPAANPLRPSQRGRERCSPRGPASSSA